MKTLTVGNYVHVFPRSGDMFNKWFPGTVEVVLGNNIIVKRISDGSHFNVNPTQVLDGLKSELEKV